jgi:hypothetical protein
MNTNEGENGNSLNPEADEVIDLEEGLEGEELKEQNKKLIEQNKQLFVRTKKAEGFVLVGDKWVKPPKEEKKPEATADQKKEDENLSQSDVITIIRNNIPDEDIPDIVEYAKLKNISISEALKTNVVKSILADKAEARKVAEGTATGATRRGSGKMSDDSLLENANNGKLPESDDDIKRLVELRRKAK